jgi:uncharacterized hydantoinase/oxoprolinase family protein
MPTQGAFVPLYLAKKKLLNETVKLITHTYHAVLTASTQAISASFVGSSADARYADLTAELATANGYTSGGVALTGNAVSLSGAVATFDLDDATWSLTSAVTFKYCLIVDWSSTNKDIVGYFDMDTGGGSVNPAAGPMTIAVTGLFNLT